MSMLLMYQPRVAPVRTSAVAALGMSLFCATTLLLPNSADAADPESRVKSRAPNKAPARPEADANDRGDPKDSGDPNDRGGTGPTKPRAPAKPAPATVVREFPEGSPIWVVRQAFHCALDFDASSGFECYAPLHVENNRNNSNALTHLRRYQWAHFRKWATTYPQPGKGFALLVTRQVPEKLEATDGEVKIFLVSRHRDSPAPVTLRREGSHWRLYASSL